MPEWVKKGLLLSASKVAELIEWSDGFTQAPNAVVLEQSLRVYFTTRGVPDDAGMVKSWGAFVDFSEPKAHAIIGAASEPILDLGGIGEFDEFGTYPVSVEHAGGRFFAYYGGWTRGESVPFDVGIGLGTSDDGRKFSRFGKGPVLSANRDEPFVVTSPKIRRFDNLWVLSYTAGTRWFMSDGRPEIIYKLRMAISEDGINWLRLGKNLVPDLLGPGEAQASPDITFSNGSYHMFFCYRHAEDFRRNKSRAYRIGYAKSQDLFSWERIEHSFQLHPSVSGWDSTMVAYPHVFNWRSNWYMLYLGNEVGKDGIGVAKLDGELA